AADGPYGFSFELKRTTFPTGETSLPDLRHEPLTFRWPTAAYAALAAISVEKLRRERVCLVIVRSSWFVITIPGSGRRGERKSINIHGVVPRRNEIRFSIAI